MKVHMVAEFVEISDGLDVNGECGDTSWPTLRLLCGRLGRSKWWRRKRLGWEIVCLVSDIEVDVRTHGCVVSLELVGRF